MQLPYNINPIENIRRNILVVDDQEINRLLLKHILESEYDLDFASNGQEALTLLRTSRHRISTVLLDLTMPVMDGYEVLAAMQKDKALSGIPVIVTTQKEGDAEEIRALALGASDFLTKPYNPEIIRYRVSNTIKLMETAAVLTQTERDTLTGLYARSFFYSYCERLMEENPDTDFDIIAMDIDQFKLINDLNGRETGDSILKEFADSLRGTTHMTGGIVSRMSADHFLLFLPRRNDYETFLPLFTSQITKKDISPKIKVRIGVYQVTDRAVPVSIMCDRATMAANEAKKHFDSIFVFYDDSMRQQMMDEQVLSGELEEALKEHQFIVYFQPKYRIADETLSGAEALVRWLHPSRGLISPGVFIPLFESNGQISLLDRYVWRETCRMLRFWKDTLGTSVPVSVNISRVDIYDPQLPEFLLGLLKEYRLTTDDLYLEITESAYTRDPDQLIAIIKELKSRGFVIEMDDFGSGYSSLNMLSKLPLDVLKLDLRFLKGEKITAEDPGLLTFIMEIARWMNARVVAEGVETKEHLSMLRRLGCDYAQGFYYARPLPPDEFAKRLENR